MTILGEFIRQSVLKANQDAENQRAKALTDDELKSCWDRWDGCENVDGLSGETVHTELSRRGFKNYVSI